MDRVNSGLRWTVLALSVGLVGPAAVTRGQTILNNPYQAYEPRGNSYSLATNNPFAAQLFAAAAVINSQGQFALDQQRAVLEREKIITARIANRRAKLEQWLWERANLPTLEDDRQLFMRESLRRYRNAPPLTEIWSGRALNELLQDLMYLTSPGGQTSAAPVDQDILSRIHVTSGARGGNVGLIRDGKITWPLLLKRPDFDTERQQLDRLVALAVTQAGQGPVDAPVLEEILQQARNLNNSLGTQARTLRDRATWTYTQYVDAKSFLNQFDDAVKVLQQPDAGRFVTGKYAIQARTAAEVVSFMKKNGLRFAPATPGTETAYTALHAVLADYSREAGQQLPAAK